MSLLEFIASIKTSEYVATLIGVLIGWLVKHTKAIREIQKLEIEIDKLRLELVDSLNQTDEERRAIAKKIGNTMKQLIASIQKNDFKEVKVKREELREEYFLDYLGVFNKYLDKGKIVRQKDKEIFIDEDLFPFLELSKDVINVLNLNMFISEMGFDKISLRKEDIAFAFKYIANNLSKRKIDKQQKLNELANCFEIDLNDFKKKYWYQNLIKK